MQLLGWRWLPNWGAAVLRPYMKEYRQGCPWWREANASVPEDRRTEEAA
jgi:hypothetical protein